jgi:hypothetical protein
LVFFAGNKNLHFLRVLFLLLSWYILGLTITACPPDVDDDRLMQKFGTLLVEAPKGPNPVNI